MSEVDFYRVLAIFSIAFAITALFEARYEWCFILVAMAIVDYLLSKRSV